MSVCPKSADQFLDLMRKRHGVLLQSRISKKPGEFKRQKWERKDRQGNDERRTFFKGSIKNHHPSGRQKTSDRNLTLLIRSKDRA